MGQKKTNKWDMVGAYPVCTKCGSKKVVRDAWAEWRISNNSWELKSIFDTFACDKCGENMVPAWKLDQDYRKKRIRRLNDALRRGHCENGSIVITQGVQAMGDDNLAIVATKVSAFGEFSEDNDPHQEHDFGSITLEDTKLFWKIDYFDLDLKCLSPDPASSAHTNRVLTIMLASEY